MQLLTKSEEMYIPLQACPMLEVEYGQRCEFDLA